MKDGTDAVDGLAAAVNRSPYVRDGVNNNKKNTSHVMCASSSPVVKITNIFLQINVNHNR